MTGWDAKLIATLTPDQKRAHKIFELVIENCSPKGLCMGCIENGDVEIEFDNGLLKGPQWADYVKVLDEIAAEMKVYLI